MRENKPHGHTSEERPPCEINHLFGGSPCTKASKEMVDGLLLCERHALEVKLEGQISCWGEMLFHIDLWSREARRRQREDIVGLLEDQRIEAISARHRAYEDLHMLRGRRREIRPLELTEDQQPPPPPKTMRRGSLLLLPPRGGVRQLAVRLRGHRRR